MSMPDKANYVLYSIIYIAAGFFILRGFFKVSGSSKNFPKQKNKVNDEQIREIIKYIWFSQREAGIHSS
jgi:hypothetical protein